MTCHGTLAGHLLTNNSKITRFVTKQHSLHPFDFFVITARSELW